MHIGLIGGFLTNNIFSNSEVKQLTSMVSPFSLTSDRLIGEDFLLESYTSNQRYDLCKCSADIASGQKFDVIFCDFSAYFCDLIKITYGNKVSYITKNLYTKNQLNDILNYCRQKKFVISEVNINNIDIEKIKKCVADISKKISKLHKDSKIVVLELCRACFTFIDNKLSPIQSTTSFSDLVICENINNIFKHTFVNALFIKMPQFPLGKYNFDERYGTNILLLKDYLTECLVGCKNINQPFFDKCFIKYNHLNDKNIYSTYIISLVRDAKKMCDHDSKIIIIGNNKFVSSEIKKCFSNCSEIIYSKTEDDDAVFERLIKNIEGAKTKLIFTSLPSKSTLLFKLMHKGLRLGIDIIIGSIPSIILNNFKGRYIDPFNNVINSAPCIKRISIESIGSYVEIKPTPFNFDVNIKVHTCSQMLIEANSKIFNTTFVLSQNALLLAGEKTIFNAKCQIYLNPCTVTKIGQDCMFSTECIINNGDAHAIFDIFSGENISTNYSTLLPKKFTIAIGNHCWFGRQVCILNGCNLGDGSIVGARSFINKKFPNNCIVAGYPARILRRNVCWSRNANYSNFNDLKKYDKSCSNYAKVTIDE